MPSYMGLQGSRLNLAALILVVSPAFLCYGYNQAVFGGLLTLEDFVNTFPAMDTINTSGSQKTNNANIQGTVVALYLVGGIFGSLSCIYLGDKLGRRWVIFLSSGISIVGAVLMASATSLAQMIVARLTLGLGTGGYVATVPVWHAELSKPSKRGADVVTTGFFIGAGIAISLWLDLGFYFVSSSISWRVPLALQIVLSLTVMGSIFFLPESPRWLMKKSRVEEARAVLAALDQTCPESPEIDDTLTRMKSSITVCQSSSVLDLFRRSSQKNSGRLLHRTILAVLGQTFQQLCGINAISFYATTIFEQYLHLPPTASRILAAGMSTTQPLGGILAYYLIDRLGRRKLMLTTSALMAALMAILAGCTITTSTSTTTTSSTDPKLIIAVLALFLFPLIFTVGFAGLTFLYATEVAPTSHRAAINAISTGAVWVVNFLLVQVTPLGFDRLGGWYWVVFAGVNAGVVGPCVYWLFPETGGWGLEEVDVIFGGVGDGSGHGAGMGEGEEGEEGEKVGWLSVVGRARRMGRERRRREADVRDGVVVEGEGGGEGSVEVLEVQAARNSVVEGRDEKS